MNHTIDIRPSASDRPERGGIVGSYISLAFGVKVHSDDAGYWRALAAEASELARKNGADR